MSSHGQITTPAGQFCEVDLAGLKPNHHDPIFLQYFDTVGQESLSHKNTVPDMTNNVFGGKFRGQIEPRYYTDRLSMFSLGQPLTDGPDRERTGTPTVV